MALVYLLVLVVAGVVIGVVIAQVKKNRRKEHQRLDGLVQRIEQDLGPRLTATHLKFALIEVGGYDILLTQPALPNTSDDMATIVSEFAQRWRITGKFKIKSVGRLERRDGSLLIYQVVAGHDAALEAVKRVVLLEKPDLTVAMKR